MICPQDSLHLESIKRIIENERVFSESREESNA